MKHRYGQVSGLALVGLAVVTAAGSVFGYVEGGSIKVETAGFGYNSYDSGLKAGGVAIREVRIGDIRLSGGISQIEGAQTYSVSLEAGNSQILSFGVEDANFPEGGMGGGMSGDYKGPILAVSCYRDKTLIQKGTHVELQNGGCFGGGKERK